MPPELEQSGIEALFEVAEFTRGLDKYLKGLKDAESGTEKTSSAVNRSGNIFSSVASKVGGFGKVLGGIGGIFMDVAKTAAGFIIGDIVGDAIRSAAAAIPDMIGKASDLNETISKTNVIFGDAAGEVLAFSENTATTLGQSQQAALDAAATFGVFGKAAGLTGSDLATFSTDFATLASDLASFNNTTPEEATLALGAALRGESEPLRRYGVLLDDASLRQKALELGIISSTKNALTPQQKILAAQALIFEQTADAQGDFARTSEGMANQQRILAAQLDNVKTQIGSALLPVVNQFMLLINEFVQSDQFKAWLDTIVVALSEFGVWLGENLPIAIQTLSDFWTGTLQPALSNFWAFVQANVIPLLQDLWAWLSVNLPPAIQALSDFWTNTLQPALANLWTFVQTEIFPIIQTLWDWLMVNLPPAIQALSDFWTNTLQPALANLWTFVQTTVFPILQTLFDWIAVNLPPAIQTLADFWTNTLWPALQAIWEFLTVDMMPVWVALGELLQVTIGRAIEALAALWTNVLQPALSDIWEFIRDKIVPMFQSWIEALGGVKAIIETIVGWIEDLTDAIAEMELPDWLTPGSPTPFEMGLRGISDALADLDKIALPGFSGSLSPAGGAAAAGSVRPAPAMASRSVTTNQNFNSTVNLGGVSIAQPIDLATFQAMLNKAIRR